MSYKPLKSKDLLKILTIFTVNILVVLFLFLNLPKVDFFILISTLIVVPAGILLVGYFLMKREVNYSIFFKAFRICNIYMSLICLTLSFIAIYNIGIDSVFLVVSITLGTGLYSLLLNFFLKYTIYEHKEWVAKNGILSYKEK